MFHVFEISAAPHLPFALRSIAPHFDAAEAPSSDDAATARELLADGIVFAAAVN
jgi:hypothetical protein